MISLLLPSRQRPWQLDRFITTATVMADNPIEIVVYIDDDDESYPADYFRHHKNLKIIRGPRTHDGKVNLSIKWNECWKNATGDYFGHMGDDIVFKSVGWDTKIQAAIDARPGKICFAWGNDFSPESERHVFGTHGFIHKNWTDITGRFVPPYFVSDYNDTWFNDVAESLHARTYVHEVWTEHLHFSLGKAEIDQNTKERLERHILDDPEKIYRETADERERERELLQEFINEHRD